jgi:hypothetical protein
MNCSNLKIWSSSFTKHSRLIYWERLFRDCDERERQPEESDDEEGVRDKEEWSIVPDMCVVRIDERC